VAAAGRPVVGNESNRCVDVTDGRAATGTPLQLWDCTGADWQKWEFRSSDRTVRSLGMCMEVAGGSTADGAAVQLARCTGGGAQRFVMSDAGDLVNIQADKCVDAKDKGTENGVRLQLWQCTGTPNQKWHLR
jgi:hypothetical protein